MNVADSDRKKALKILFTTYCPSKGWKAEKRQVTPRGNLRFDKRAGSCSIPSGPPTRRSSGVRSTCGPGVKPEAR